MRWRPVGKREFGETVRPCAETRGEIVVDADGHYRRGDDWHAMPRRPELDDE